MMRRLSMSLCSVIASIAVLAAQGTSAPPASQGQSPPPASQGQPPQQPQQPTFRARVDSVSVDVSVTDKQGKPVTDLTIDDFEIREANKPQTVDSFKLVAVDEEKDLDPGRYRDILSFSDMRRETEDPQNRLFVIFLDDYHVRLGNSMRIREQVARFVSQLGPRDLVAILYPLTPIAAATFSRNHQATAAAIMKFAGRKYDYIPKNDYERQMENQPPEYIEQVRNELVIRSLDSTCVYLGSLKEGRKVILLVSEGMTATLPIGVQTTGTMPFVASGSSTQSSQAFFRTTDLMSRMRDIFSAASHSNTSIFTLDPRGLATSEFGINDRVNFESDRQVLNDAIDSLRVIADQTDGRAIVNRNDPLPELKKMVQELSAYYLLGYTSTVAPRDGKFHPITVRVKRKDVVVNHRKGYWAYTEDDARMATEAPKAGPPAAITDALEELAGIVEPTSRRPVTVWLGAARGAGEKAQVTLAWEVPAQPALDPIDRVARISLTATAVTGDALFRGPSPPDPAAAGRVAGHLTFDSPAGLVRLRLVTENARGQRLDTEDLTFDVPDFTGTTSMISTPVLFRGRTARDIAQLRGVTTALPSAGRQFSRTERLLLRFDAYGPAGTTPKLSLRLLNRLGESITPLPDPAPASGSTFEAELTLGSLPPGDYLIEIAAQGASDTARRLVGIRVTG